MARAYLKCNRTKSEVWKIEDLEKNFDFEEEKTIRDEIKKLNIDAFWVVETFDEPATVANKEYPYILTGLVRTNAFVREVLLGYIAPKRDIRLY